MKHRVLIVLIILVLSVTSVGIAAAQGGTELKAVATAGVTIYAEPNTGAEVVTELAAFSEVKVLATDASGNWLKVATADGEGYAPLDSFSVLDLPLLASKVYVATGRTGATALYSKPDVASEYLDALSDGTMGTLLTTYGQWAYVDSTAGKGWSIATAWATFPEDAQAAVVTLGRAPELGVFEQPLVGANLVATFPEETVLYWMGAPDGEWVEVFLPDGTTGYAIASSFTPLPMVMVDAVNTSDATAALYAAPDFGAAVLGALENGTSLVFVEQVDDYWMKLYHPSFGMAYGMTDKFSPKYTVATVQVPGAVVRIGPNDNLYNAVAELPAGTAVVVKGLSESGAWIQVAIPFDEVDFGYNGVEGWMRDFLFTDALGNSDLNKDLLSVTE